MATDQPGKAGVAAHTGSLPKTTSLRRPAVSLFGASAGRRLGTHATLLILCLPALLPFVWMVTTSLKASNEIYATSFSLATLIPFHPHWHNYTAAVQAIPFETYLRNTLFLCLFTVIGAVSSSAITAYGFAKTEFKGKNLLFLLMISTMAIPPQVTMVPIFAMFRWLHWFGTYLPLIVPTFFGVPFFIFLLTQFYRNLPNELPEAARIDGAGEWRIFWQVILPLSRPALVTCALFQFLNTWNDFFGPLLYLNDPSKYTLAYGLQQFLGIHGAEWSRLMAASTLFVLPIVVLFFFAQKTFIQGVATTGGKN
jgi:multiple sugar transport system permease protein